MKEQVKQHLDLLIERYPVLKYVREDIKAVFEVLKTSYDAGGKLLAAGNGGSCADTEHIVGELMKGFVLKREVLPQFQQALSAVDAEAGKALFQKLQRGLPAIALSSHMALNTAYINDVYAEFMYAQQLSVLGKAGDVFLGISTSGNAENVYYAAVTAKAMGMKVVALTGNTGGRLKEISDAAVVVPCDVTYMIQELHLPIYHCICLMLETHYFGE